MAGDGEEVAAERAVLLHVDDHRLDAGAPPDLASDGRRDAALLAGTEHAALVGFVAAVAAVDIGTLDRHAGDALGLGDLCGGERLGEQQFEPLGANALASACHRGAIERQGVLEMALAAEELDIGALEEAGADGVVGEDVHVLDLVQADHEVGR